MKKCQVLLKKLTEQKGFTLVEVMVVIVIIGILASVTIPQFSKQADKAKTARAEVEMKSMANIINIYYAEKGQYPMKSNDDTDGTVAKVLKDNGLKWGSSDAIKDPWGNAYFYDATVESSKVTGFKLYCYGSDQATDKESNITISGNKDSVTAPTTGKVTTITGVKSDGST
ncbi:type II secretion system protein GspG [Desulforamulus aeronauticus]|uniref:General secretion pathway protein G n=1 Tax=Desulforamulus aeronauticus DSM 10349 TaxID=1121421 RepID=A0A1M6PHY4_9FIRM|nr:type II secretion system protein GspG [Desulforamulus aeronauticus]SHK07555.1 general secretion pathway protein G [Desulforamulus aeronauticus DSM 10349]